MNHDKEVLKVILLGNGGVGKSSLMRRYVNGIFEAKTLHTIGVEFLNKTVEFNKKTFTLQVKHTVIQSILMCSSHTYIYLFALLLQFP